MSLSSHPMCCFVERMDSSTLITCFVVLVYVVRLLSNPTPFNLLVIFTYMCNVAVNGLQKSKFSSSSSSGGGGGGGGGSSSGGDGGGGGGGGSSSSGRSSSSGSSKTKHNIISS